ncbi:ethanolamine-phosphate phospho-lyase isoform X3 [Procambarus clarkii]|uniref:ethanolamine-phosphate phospho-lyase isoform X3 n=1 Tax=Procambarus clarkii TaxID=6728 RepID=UPI00374436B5
MDGREVCATVHRLHYHTAPLKIVRAQKQYMTDNVGVQYLDCVSNIAHVGHCHPQVVAAGKNQMGLLGSAQGFVNDILNKYVKQLLSKLPDILSVCYLVNSGSEANDLALRLAKSYTNKMDIVVFDEAYHGNLGNLIDISPKMFKRMTQGKKEFVHIIPYPDTYSGAYRENDSQAADKYVKEAERIITQATDNGRKIGCFISECIIVNCGIIFPPRNYFKDLYNLIREAGGVCIADEVQTGLGRTGEHFWAFEHFGVVPDIVTVGKPLGNGHPMAAVITTRDIADALGDYYSTVQGPNRNVITITPPMCFTQLNARSLFNALDAVLSACSEQRPGSSNIDVQQSRPVLSTEDLDNLEEEDAERPQAKRPRTSYDDID